ncbi:hypothetical protein D0T53_09515 [Dysgonomonas sp. 216]|uniref:BNR-4 repeat-containing protein n=1 Tax=Dysgonomonas sp. 216 TaxID=2302934 RepID=UPI0013D3F01A|nr:BNR-4 repeat-containing protein [Dysgonomonas sp. 216]NDW19148.1 hypothetical protein [Dysgonomonas sp. 216]
MKKLFISLFTLFLGFASYVSGQGVVSSVKIGELFLPSSSFTISGEQLTGQAFQQDALITYKNYQYTVYYNSTRNVCIARRKMPLGQWEEIVLPYQNSENDAHNVISMGICANDGSIHLSYDHHNHPLHYCYSLEGSANDPENMPWQAGNFSQTTDVMDTQVKDVTYPRFINKPDGNLLFECRYKLSGDGDSYLREYDGNAKQWTYIGRYVQGRDANPDVCAYINRIDYDKNGRLHVSWCWREYYGGETNKDLSYAYSDDDGRTWKDITGIKVAESEPDYVPVPGEDARDRVTSKCLSIKIPSLKIKDIPKNKGYINQESQTSDSKGRPHMINSYMDEGTDSNWSTSRTKAVLHHHFIDESGVLQHRYVKNGNAKVNSYCRTQIVADAFDNVYVIANHGEVYVATEAGDYDDWQLLAKQDQDIFLSEPQVDRKLLLKEGVLSFVYLRSDAKVVVVNYLLDNPNTPAGTGVLAEYFSDDNFSTIISSSDNSNINGQAFPLGTKSVRWSGTFETQYGENYTMYLSTSEASAVYVDGKKVLLTKKSSVAEEYEFTFSPIASHKHNIVIESQVESSNPVTLSWASGKTNKEVIPVDALYSEKANDDDVVTTEPDLRKKAELDNILLSEKKSVNTTGKETFEVTPFNPLNAYSLEVKAKINSATGRGMDIEARSKTGKGFRFSLGETSISESSVLNNITKFAVADNSVEQSYRFAVVDNNVYVYCGQEYLGATTIEDIKNIQADDTETEPTASYGNDIMPEWAGPNALGSAKPTEYGWSASASDIPWNAVGGMGVRYENVTHNLENGGSFTGRLMTIRWDATSYASATYFYPVTLEANTVYELSFLYECWANATSTASITTGISQAKDATGIYKSETHITPTATQTLRRGTFTFTTKDAGTYYLTFSGAWAMYGIGDFRLKGISYENRLLIGKNYNEGSADFEVFSVTYQDGAYAPGEGSGDTPNLSVKEILPTRLAENVTITALTGSKNVKLLDFNPADEYTLEIAATVTSADGRGMDFEARDENGSGLRTSLSSSSLTWILPFAQPLTIASTGTTEQVVRYAVQSDKVHVYRNGEYEESFDKASVGDMNADGTTETDIISGISIYDESNIIANPDFKATANNEAPSGWISEKTLGGGTNPRVQVNNNEIPGTDPTRAAFVFRFDNDSDYGTWYSYGVQLKPSTWYEYAFDLITWGENQSKTFNIIVSTSQDGTTGSVVNKSVTTPSVRATAERKVVRFKTSESENPTDQYYLTFSKSAGMGTTGVTNLSLIEHSANRILFGKNYASGSADIQVNYISYDQSGAYAPAASVSIGDEDQLKDSYVKFVVANGTVTICSDSKILNVAIYDVMGRCCLNSKCYENVYTADMAQQGLYVVKVKTIRGEYVKKVVVKY